MTKAQRAKIFAKAYSNFITIESAKDLKRNKLSLSDYNIVLICLKKLSGLNDDDFVLTFVESVADWFIRHDFKVKLEGVNYRISID